MLNDKAREILDFIRRFSRERHIPPTIREIGIEASIASTNGVRYYLDRLEEEGYIRRNPKISRGIELVTHDDRDTESLPGIPILGRVAAGQPILANESYDGSIEPTRVFGDPAGLFALRVRGDSMIDAGILEGDYVVVRSQDRAVAGEMVVALIGDEATVKYFRPKGDHVELEPANERYEPIVVPRSSELRILGVVKGVIRTVGR